MKYSFIQQAFTGPVDIVGDIHGEIAALEQLIQVLVMTGMVIIQNSAN